MRKPIIAALGAAAAALAGLTWWAKKHNHYLARHARRDGGDTDD